jgi:hypothetical protein
MSTPGYEWGAEGEFEDETAFDSFGGAPSLREIARSAAEAVLESVGEGEDEWAWESEIEGEAELNPVRKVYSDAAMEHLAHAAMSAESEGEAGRAMRPVVRMAASRVIPVVVRAAPAVRHAMPKVVHAVARVTPHLTQGVTRVAHTLHRNPQTRVLLRAVPSIARRTIGTLARQVANGTHLTPQLALRTLARQTAGVLGRPHRLAGAVRRSRVLDRVFHRRVAPALAAAPGLRRTIYGPGGTVYTPTGGPSGRTVYSPTGRPGIYAPGGRPMVGPHAGGCCGCCCSCRCGRRS